MDEVFSLFAELNRNGLSILLVEQNIVKALSIAHRGYVLERGELVTTGEPGSLLVDERLTEAYLGGGAGTEA